MRETFQTLSRARGYDRNRSVLRPTSVDLTRSYGYRHALRIVWHGTGCIVGLHMRSTSVKLLADLPESHDAGMKTVCFRTYLPTLPKIVMTTTKIEKKFLSVLMACNLCMHSIHLYSYIPMR